MIAKHSYCLFIVMTVMLQLSFAARGNWLNSGAKIRSNIDHLSVACKNRSLASISSGKSDGFVDGDVVKLSETTVFQGYRNIVQRDFQLANGKRASFDVLTQKHLSVSVFVWNSTSATTTLIREYHPGPEKHLFGTVAGMYESSKHQSPLHASQLELEEEAQLQSDRWIPLLDTAETGMYLDKYSTNRFFPYLALDCTTVCNPRPMDEEEMIEVEHNVTFDRMMAFVTAGQMNVVSTFTVLLAVNKLRELGIPLVKQ